ncbi:MAG TPA: PAS domain-containing protein [Luteibacter sp.]|jgi:PAS domain S-box-containing protein|nr:PAS domain-containing protein [Luteibacter sp.]
MESEPSRVIDALPGLVWTALPDGQVDYLNRPWCDYTGLTMTDACGSGWLAAIHPGDADRLLPYWRSLLDTGHAGQIEARLRRHDGTFHWFLIRAAPLSDQDGRIAKWYGLNTDIDERKRFEALLEGEKRLLEMVAIGSSLATVLAALRQLVEDTIDDCHCDIQLDDRSGAGLQHGDAPCLATPISGAGGKIIGVLSIYASRPGTPTPSLEVLADRFTRIAGIAIERAQNDEALKRSEDFLAKTRRMSSTGGFSKRVATGEITWSEEVYRMFEFDPAVPVTLEQILTRIHPEDIHSFDDMLSRQREGRDYEHEYRLLMPDQSIKYLHVVAHANHDADGQLEYIAAIQDVTERRRSEDALGKVRSELAHMARVTSLGALTASIAHEVSQPLSGIITNASTCLRMLAADPPNVDGARETARRTIRDGDRASDVIRRLRALFSKTTTTTEWVDLNDVAREVMALSRSELQRSRVILRPDLAEGLPPVTGDRVQLQQVILNLLLNASDAMSGIEDRPRHLVIRSENEEGDSVRLTVQDVGVGFRPEDAEKLFESFYTTKRGGMGIGLSVSRSIIESHQGRLWAIANDGPGATFAFSIPRRPGKVMGARQLGVF